MIPNQLTPGTHRDSIHDTSVSDPAPQDAGDILRTLEEQLTAGYKPSIPLLGMFSAAGLPQMYLRQDIEPMLTHPDVRQSLAYYKGGIAGAEFWGGQNPDNPEDEIGLPICPENEQVGRFIKEQVEKFWDRGVPQIQWGYEYGWIGCENIYEECEGVLKWLGLFAFAPTDTFLLTQDFNPVGVRVKNVQDRDWVDLWMAGDDVPAKGLWYAHQPRYNAFYGQSQLMAAWRPWRRLAWKDGLETVIDGALYRNGYAGPLMRFPDEDLQGPAAGIPNTSQDSAGNARRYARDIMRQIGEQLKAGGTVGLPSKRDKDGNYLYDMTLPTSVLTGIQGLIDAAKALSKQISAGIGVPPELLEAAETGSGYSGRRIPLEAFLANQQQIADAMLKLFTDQVLRPMVKWNFGDVRFNIQVKSLIKTRTKQAQAAEGMKNQPSQAQGFPPQAQPQQSQQGAIFSTNSLVTDRIREIARKIVRGA